MVSFVQFAVISLQSDVAEEFNSIRALDSEDWNFFVTVAHVYCALAWLVPKVSAERYSVLCSIVNTELNAWNRNGQRALEDCTNFVNRTAQRLVSDEGHKQRTEDKFAYTDALGMWVLWNLYGRKTSYEKARPARAIGGVAFTSMASYWD